MWIPLQTHWVLVCLSPAWNENGVFFQLLLERYLVRQAGSGGGSCIFQCFLQNILASRNGCDNLSYSAITICVYTFVLVPWARNREDASITVKIMNLHAFFLSYPENICGRNCYFTFSFLLIMLNLNIMIQGNIWDLSNPKHTDKWLKMWQWQGVCMME